MKHVLAVLILLLAALILAVPVTAHQRGGVKITIVDDNGTEFQTIPFKKTRQGSTWVSKDYLEAKKGANYSIIVRNNTPDRIGIVIAVDGRNIISGEKSYLKNNERMYIVRPYERTKLDGWRTDQDTVHRFYFTDEKDSYSVRTFSDSSAMGVVAAAVFREKVPKRESFNRRSYKDKAAKAPAAGMQEFESDSAGTGFGTKKHSPSVKVRFKPEHIPFEKLLVKYEWRKTLCEKALINCRQYGDNRLWDDNSYAPYPPGH